MSQRRLLSLFCLSLLFLLVVQLTRAGGDLSVNESRTRFVLHTDRAEVLFAVENTTGETRSASVKLELLDKHDDVLSETTATQLIAPGSQTLRLNLPPFVADLSKFNPREVIWYRLRYRMVEIVRSSISIRNGIISLSQIMPDLFEVRVATADYAYEGERHRVRAQAVHPFTHRPAAGVEIKGEIVFEDDNRKPTASATTNKEGYALLDLVLPPKLSETRGYLHVVGTRDGVTDEAEGAILVDSMVRTIITTDKALYQPGQTMHIRALALSPAKRALANQDIVIRVFDPERVTVFTTTTRSSRFGIVNADWPIPDNVRLGDYQIGVDRDGESHQADFSVRISRYDLPNFSVNVEPDRGFYLPGQNAKVKVRADYLFGQPVKRGHVRVVKEKNREWNYREQKWDTDEGVDYEGETDAQGVFVANVDLADEQDDLGGWHSSQFQDLTYAAYFTDPTTNRTEQRRFSLRVTKQAIHVYLVNNPAESGQSHGRPLRFYVSTFYADGSPARCKVNVELIPDEKPKAEEPGSDRRLRRTIHTNRYGLAKASIGLDDHFDVGTSLTLQVRATDSSGRSGSAKLEEFWVDDESGVFVDTEKTLYRKGEPIIASVTSSLPDQTVLVEVAKDWNVIRSERVRLRGGRATVNFSYVPDFTGPIIIAAYPDFAKKERLIGVRTVLYPTDSELNLDVQTSQATYRPGEDANVRFNVRTSGGQSAESALGVVVFDKAVDERMRSDSEFGGRYQPYNNTLTRFLGLSEQLSGVTYRDLTRLDMTKPVSPDLELLAEILLNYYRNYYPTFYRSDKFETGLERIFGPLINQQLAPFYDALQARYQRTLQHPSDEPTLRQFLRDAGLDFQQLYDPWGMNYRALVSIDGRFDELTLWSGGADKRFGTDDDFSVSRMRWEYFKPLGQAIQRIIDSYHKRTKLFIRDTETLRQELAREGVLLEQKRDRWDQPYRFDFVVERTNFVINVVSGGPNGSFAADANTVEDDFTIWSAQIDYFTEPQWQIDKRLTEQLTATGKFPQSESELREVLRDSPQPLETLHDPWNRSYYALFKTESVDGVSAQLENRATNGNTPTAQMQMVPVTRKIATVTLRSVGADGQQGTRDDFTAGSFSRIVAEQLRDTQQPEPAPSIVLSSKNGAIHGAVVDSNGAVISGATVTATRTPDIHRYRTSTDDKGEYVLKGLPPGSYEVRFEAHAFVTAVVMEVQVRVSRFTRVNTTMHPGAITENVVVTAKASGLNMIVDATVASYSRREARMEVTEKSGSPAAQISTPRLREYFPETLVWQPLVETDGRGRAEIKFKLADNITTWKMAVIGSTEDGRIGTAEKEFKAFQPFFVEHEPPRVLTEGDEISLPVVVRNYLDRLQRVDLEIKTENWFSLTGPARKQATVAAGDAERQTFDFRVVSSVDEGRQRITALGGDANDAIEKPVTVHPDGEQLSVTAGDLLADSASLELNLPDTVIPNSTRAELKLYPNLMAHVSEGVEAIMQRPYGCGEQTISSTYPSLLLLRNYKQTGHDFTLRTRAERYLNSGYNRLLNYRDEKGGFAYWDHANPDIALTAYALRFLTDAAGVMELDHNIIKDARKWLIQQQASDGSWPPHQFGDEGQSLKRAVLTAYVARILAATESKLISTTEDYENQERANLAASLKRAMDYVGQRSSGIDEPYLLASYALALIELRDTTRAKPLIDKLRSLAVSEDGVVYWSLETNTPFYGWGIVGRVETTALVVQALSRYCSLAEGNCDASDKLIKRGVLFLLKHKDQYGVWYSTQATINVLDTMFTLFATNKAGQNSGAGSDAQIEVNSRVVQTVKIPETRGPASPITVALTSLSVGKNRIEIKRPGGGTFSSVQALASYYVPWTDKPDKTFSNGVRLLTSFDKIESKIGDSITCHVEANRIGSNGYGMLLAEIGLPPGADVDRTALETALKNSTIMQYDVLPDRVVLYLWPYAGSIKLDFQFRPRFGMTAKTASSVIYDYYNPESRAVVPPVQFRVRD